MATATRKRKQYTAEELASMRQAALDRAESGCKLTNYPAIYEGFMSRGIPEGEIIPRVNVFTYRAWQAKGRQVRKGEKGVKVMTRILTRKEKTDGTVESHDLWATATVFHVTQTDPKSF